MTIFNVELFGSDADWFCTLSKSEQFAWVKTNTNQGDDAIINDFLATCKNNKDEYCIPCRNNKQKVSIAKIVENGNKLQGDEPQTEYSSERKSTKNSSKRRNN